MRHLFIVLAGSTAFAAAACASSTNPPAASSASVAQATSEPNRGPDFAPASNDGLAAAERDTRGSRAGTQTPTQNLPSTHERSDDTATGTWPSGAEGSSGMNPATGNAAAAAPVDRTAQAASDADNTRVNRRDRGGATLTPMDQGPSDADRKITRDIRQAVMNDSALSFTAKNVKIITVGGRVTLRGPVKTEAERTAIESAARKVVGNGALVESQLELIQ
ncbi:MAG: BON domain-containing protein [Myxococcales bacterium]